MSAFTAIYAFTVPVAMYAFKMGLGTPPPALPGEERQKNVDFTPTLIDGYRKWWPITVYIWLVVAAAESGACLIRVISNPSHSISGSTGQLAWNLCPSVGAFNPGNHPPVLAWMGCLVIFTGSMLRVWGMKSLGKLFTWEVSIRPEHKLYTRGPYTIVRHPGYLGLSLIQAGQLMFALAGGTFTNECLGWKFPTSFHLFQLLVLAQALPTYATCWRRAIVEDSLLKKKFGKSGSNGLTGRDIAFFQVSSEGCRDLMVRANETQTDALTSVAIMLGVWNWVGPCNNIDFRKGFIYQYSTQL